MKTTLYILSILIFIKSYNQEVITLAGVTDEMGMHDSTSLESTFNNPHGIAINKEGEIFIADRFNHIIRKRSLDGTISTFAGTGLIGDKDGAGNQAKFYEPWDIEIDNDGNVIVADTKNNKIKKITPEGLVSTLAGSGSFGFKDGNNPLISTFGNPSGVAVDQSNNIYVADHLTHLIRKITPNGVVSTISGSKVNFPNNHGDIDGVPSVSKIYRPYGIEVDLNNNIYFTDEWNHKIKYINSNNETITIAGSGFISDNDGKPDQASFNYPWDLVIDSNNVIYVIDGYNYTIRRITKESVSTLVGISGTQGAENGTFDQASFNGATGLTIKRDKKQIYIADAYNQLIRCFSYQLVSNSENESTSSNDTVVIIDTISNTDTIYSNSIDTIILIDTIQNTDTVTFRDTTTLINQPKTPTHFSPNNDGINDIFEFPHYNNGYLQVFDRWGTLIYSSNEITLQWDGNSSNGTPYPTGLYPFLIQYTNSNNQQERLIGQIGLCR